MGAVGGETECGMTPRMEDCNSPAVVEIGSRTGSRFLNGNNKISCKLSGSRGNAGVEYVGFKGSEINEIKVLGKGREG